MKAHSGFYQSEQPLLTPTLQRLYPGQQHHPLEEFNQVLSQKPSLAQEQALLPFPQANAFPDTSDASAQMSPSTCFSSHRIGYRPSLTMKSAGEQTSQR